jgi:VanZ family protein
MSSVFTQRRVWLTTYAPLFIWIGVIFFLGSGQGSMSNTSLIVRPLLEFLFPSATTDTLLIYHGYIRKLAHFTEYGVLGILAARAFAAAFGLRRWTVLLLALLLVLIVASLDEFRQSFEPSRTASPFDVLIDLSGGVIAVIGWSLASRRLGRTGY